MPPTGDALQVLVENHKRFLAFLQKRTGSREVAEDILQDAFVKAIPRVDSIREQESVTAWFYRLLRNALVDHFRRGSAEKRALEKMAVGAEEAEPPFDEELMDEVCRCAEALLGTLKPEYISALRSVDLGGMPVQDYAVQSGISANNAAVRLHRARQALHKRVVESCGTCTIHGCLNCTCNPSCA